MTAPDENFSANYGVEGESDDPAIERVRQRQIKNFLLTLAISRGVPMLLGRRRVPPHPARQQQRVLPGQRDELGRLVAARAARRNLPLLSTDARVPTGAPGPAPGSVLHAAGRCLVRSREGRRPIGRTHGSDAWPAAFADRVGRTCISCSTRPPTRWPLRCPGLRPDGVGSRTPERRRQAMPACAAMRSQSPTRRATRFCRSRASS